MAESFPLSRVRRSPEIEALKIAERLAHVLNKITGPHFPGQRWDLRARPHYCDVRMQGAAPLPAREYRMLVSAFAGAGIDEARTTPLGLKRLIIYASAHAGGVQPVVGEIGYQNAACCLADIKFLERHARRIKAALAQEIKIHGLSREFASAANENANSKIARRVKNMVRHCVQGLRH